MKLGANKVVKINAFGLLDTESLEAYLSKMALEGWMISKVSKTSLTFEKIDSKAIRFFVDITDKDLTGDNYIPTKDYIDSAKEENLEHVCGNEKFQIFINRGTKKRIDKKKLKLNRVFTEEFGIIINIVIVLMPFLLGNSMFGESFINFISSNFLIIWIIAGAIVILFNLLIIILKLIKYKRIMKEDNHSFDEVTHYKPHYLLNKYVNFTGILFVTFTIISTIGFTFDDGKNISKGQMPLSLEDFNIDIQEVRECTQVRSSSPFAKYDDYYDYIGNEEPEEGSSTLSYSIFESKYHKIMDKAVYSILKEVNEYESNCKKLADKEELKNWGAKEVYEADLIYDRIIVYDDKIITISSSLDYNKKNIDIIKNKILNYDK